MICILSTSGLKKVVSNCGAEVSKAMLLVGEKPVCSHMLDELYALQEFFEKVLIVGSDLKEFEDWTKFGMHDEFFKTKLVFLKDSNAKSIDDDVWSAMDWIYSKKWRPQVIIMRPDIYTLDVSKITDGYLGSFQAYADGKPLEIWKLSDFALSINTMLKMEEEERWSLNNLVEALQSQGKLEALDITGAILPLETRGDYIAAWKMQQSDNGPVSCEVDTKRQTMKISNAWRTKRWTSSIYASERHVQSMLWDCWDFLEYASPEQKTYLQNPVDRGPNVRGEYCNWIELQLIPDASVQAIMMGRSLDQKSWQEIMDKVLDILEESFWQEQEPDWRSDADKKDRIMFVERMSDRWLDLVKEKVPVFSMIKWETLVRRYLEWMKNHVKDRKYVFHNGTGGRLVHGDLSLKTILCNWQTLDIHFVNPVNRTGILVDSFGEYSGLYADCWCLLPVFIQGKHVDYGKDGLDVPDYIAENAFEIESILDSRLGEKSAYAKTEALLQALSSIELVPEEHKKAFLAFLQYRANELYLGSVQSKVSIINEFQPCIGEIGGKSACLKRKLPPLCHPRCLKSCRKMPF